MKLIAEQIKLLRERKKDLERVRKDYIEYCIDRDRVDLDSNSTHPTFDYSEEVSMSNANHEVREINSALNKAEFVFDRNFDFIDVGTKFTVMFDGDEDDTETLLLTESIPGATFQSDFVSLESDLGNAVYGKKKGEVARFTVQATGTPVSVTIKDIKNMMDEYEHFIREYPFSSRGSSTQRKKYSELVREDSDRYNALTESQVELVQEEIEKMNRKDLTPVQKKRKNTLSQMLESSSIAHPYGEEIDIGSFVSVSIEKDGEIIDKDFELINRAVSTELHSHYVERFSPLGSAVMGHKVGETFRIVRQNQPSLKGVVTMVQNYKENEKTL